MRASLLAELRALIHDLRHDIGRGGPAQPLIDNVLDTIATRLEAIVSTWGQQLPPSDAHQGEPLCRR